MKKKALFYVVMAGVLWGTSAIFVHYLSPMGFTSNQMAAVRATVSLICLTGYVLFRARHCLRIKPMHLLLYAALGASLFFASSCYYSSMQMTSVSTAVVLLYASPVYVVTFSVLFLNERMNKSKLIAIVCMLAGCLLMSGVLGNGSWNFKGVLLGILSGVAYASYSVLTKIAMKHKLEPLTVSLYGYLFMALIALFSLKPTAFSANVARNPAVSIPLLIGLGIFTFMLPYVLYTLAIKILPVGTCAALSIMEPMAATIFSVVLFHERLNLLSVLGILAILFATVLIGKQEEETPDTVGVELVEQQETSCYGN